MWQTEWPMEIQRTSGFTTGFTMFCFLFSPVLVFLQVYFLVPLCCWIRQIFMLNKTCRTCFVLQKRSGRRDIKVLRLTGHLHASVSWRNVDQQRVGVPLWPRPRQVLLVMEVGLQPLWNLLSDWPMWHRWRIRRKTRARLRTNGDLKMCNSRSIIWFFRCGCGRVVLVGERLHVVHNDPEAQFCLILCPTVGFSVCIFCLTDCLIVFLSTVHFTLVIFYLFSYLTSRLFHYLQSYFLSASPILSYLPPAPLFSLSSVSFF